jgi:F-type H+-transporting ATPase subunit gamma
MANIRLIKRRIKTAKNIAQITKAMELVAASKMKKAQQAAISGKLYAAKIYEMVMKLAAKTDYTSHPLLNKPKIPTGRRMVVLISTNKGLCGGLNTNLFRFTANTYKSQNNVDVVAVGRKGADFAVRFGKPVVADFSTVTPFTNSVPAVTELITAKYLAGNYDAIDLVYNEFITVVNQKPRQKTILPLTLEQVPEDSGDVSGEFLIEPDVATVFDRLLPHYLENQIRDAMLQAEASEHSARMVAMRNATDNATSLTEELTLVYNKVRQEKITYEINDIVTARLASES